MEPMTISQSFSSFTDEQRRDIDLLTEEQWKFTGSRDHPIWSIQSPWKEGLFILPQLLLGQLFSTLSRYPDLPLRPMDFWRLQLLHRDKRFKKIFSRNKSFEAIRKRIFSREKKWETWGPLSILKGLQDCHPKSLEEFSQQKVSKGAVCIFNPKDGKALWFHMDLLDLPRKELVKVFFKEVRGAYYCRDRQGIEEFLKRRGESKAMTCPSGELPEDYETGYFEQLLFMLRDLKKVKNAPVVSKWLEREKKRVLEQILGEKAEERNSFPFTLQYPIGLMDPQDVPGHVLWVADKEGEGDPFLTRYSVLERISNCGETFDWNQLEYSNLWFLFLSGKQSPEDCYCENARDFPIEKLRQWVQLSNQISSCLLTEAIEKSFQKAFFLFQEFYQKQLALGGWTNRKKKNEEALQGWLKLLDFCQLLTLGGSSNELVDQFTRGVLFHCALDEWKLGEEIEKKVYNVLDAMRKRQPESFQKFKRDLFLYLKKTSRSLADVEGGYACLSRMILEGDLLNLRSNHFHSFLPHLKGLRSIRIPTQLFQKNHLEAAWLRGALRQCSELKKIEEVFPASKNKMTLSLYPRKKRWIAVCSEEKKGRRKVPKIVTVYGEWKELILKEVFVHSVQVQGSCDVIRFQNCSLRCLTEKSFSGLSLKEVHMDSSSWKSLRVETYVRLLQKLHAKGGKLILDGFDEQKLPDPWKKCVKDLQKGGYFSKISYFVSYLIGGDGKSEKQGNQLLGELIYTETAPVNETRH